MNKSSQEWYEQLKYELENPEDKCSINLKYSLNYSGEKTYTLDKIVNFIDKVLLRYVVSEKEESNNDSCVHCGYGYKSWYIVLLKNNNYAFIDLWSGCLSYGSIIISNSLIDLENMCMSNTQREQYDETKTKIV